MSNTDDLGDPEPEAKDDPSTALFLALYLLLLAFFIVLNTISTIEELKAKAIMDNLKTTFTTLLSPARLDTFTSQVGDVVASQELHEEVTQLFETAIPAVRVTLVQPGRAMQVAFHPDQLFFPDTTTLRPGRREMMDRLVASIGNPAPGKIYSMEAVFSVDPTADGFVPLEEGLAMKRAGTLARELLARGLSPDTLLTGLDKGIGGSEVRLNFHIVNEDQNRLMIGDGNSAPAGAGGTVGGGRSAPSSDAAGGAMPLLPSAVPQ